ncbi:MAG: MarR family transcriptional regulator [Flavobacteriaceae bacterium]|nr:MarR family transcriptional regulator [Muriicola sp.]MBT8289715.1 MarR family transcriptional regulator [Muriicola sp.]NNC62778.1 MarR family transcriptional regulator [Eudoraea sp.]NNK34906.1 MarR family transcriptional regulator [Eudoraea sp.]NNL39653.1 MarR family transcriptional regulator [Flavobacteriaceae bacterium]
MNVEAIIKTKKEIPLTSRTLIHLMLVNNKVVETITHALKPFGVSLQQFNVLRILRGQGDKPANLSTLNERMVTKMSNTTRLVDKLLLKGLVDRSVCEANRRKVEITITNKGLVLLREMDEIIKQTEDSLVSALNEKELIQLNTLLDKF